MELIIAISNTLAKANKLAFRQLLPLTLNREKVFVVVPDRASLNTELEIISELNVKGIFNLQVLTINSLADKIISNQKQTLSSYGAVLLVKKILNQNISNLVCFNKIAKNINFAEELYKTLQQFKASDISVNEIKGQLDKMPAGLKLKMQDILLVYEEYEKEIKNNFSDGFSRLSALQNEIKFSDEIKNANFCFAGFKTITKKIYGVIQEVILNSKKTIISAVKNNAGQENKDIYINDIYFNITDIAKSLKIIPEIIKDESVSLLENKLLAFSFSGNKQIMDSVQLWQTQNIFDETEGLSYFILNGVKNGKVFSDFNIILCDWETYKPVIEESFKNSKIPLFFDSSYSLINHSLPKFILSLINVMISDFSTDAVLSFVKNYYFSSDILGLSIFENYVNKFDINGAMYFKNFEDENAEAIRLGLIKVIEIYKKFIKEQNVLDIINDIYLLMEHFNVKQKTSVLEEELALLNDDVNLQITKQVTEKVENVFTDISLVLSNQQLTKKEFKDLLINGFSNMKISLVPLKTNSVFVGDLSASYFPNGKINYIVGANKQTFPKMLSDVGIIADKEINILNFKNKLEPSIDMLNKKALFNAFEICVSSEELIISYAENVDEEKHSPSLIAIDLQNIFNLTHKIYNPLTKWIDINENSVISSKDANSFFNILAIQKQKNNPFLEDIFVALKNIFVSDNNLEQLTPIKNRIKNNLISVSELQCYFECPLKHFLKYSLKLNENPTGLLKVLEMGNIFHMFVYEFIQIINKVKISNIKENAIKIINKVLENEQFKFALSIDKNKPLINQIRKEAIKVAEKLYIHHTESEFKPNLKYIEKRFPSDSINTYFLKTESGEVGIKGVMDRVDTYEDYARVVDYKTGNSKFSLTEFYYGKKIQLITYLKILTENGYKPAGAFYYPISSKTGEKFNARLDGIMLKDTSLLEKMDINFKATGQGKLIKAKLKQGGEFSDNVNKNGILTETELNSILNYALEISAGGVNEINNGYMQAVPLKLGSKCSCDYCPFKGLGFCVDPKERTITDSVSKESFRGGAND